MALRVRASEKLRLSVTFESLFLLFWKIMESTNYFLGIILSTNNEMKNMLSRSLTLYYS